MEKDGINIAVIITIFIGVLVGLVLLPTTAQYVGITSNTIVQNSTSGQGTTYTAPTWAEGGTTIDLVGQELLSTPIVRNSTTDGIVFAAANYTIAEGISATTGLKSIQFTSNNASLDGLTLNISYEYGADGYIDNGGGRAIAGLIPLFFALAIALIMLIPTARSKVLEMIGK